MKKLRDFLRSVRNDEDADLDIFISWPALFIGLALLIWAITLFAKCN